jgi:hypothetical protein
VPHVRTNVLWSSLACAVSAATSSVDRLRHGWPLKVKSLSAVWLLRWAAGGSVRLKRPMRPLGGSVRLKRPMRPLGGSVRLKRPMRPLGGSVRLKRPMRPLGGSVRLKRLMRPLGGSVRLKRPMRRMGRFRGCSCLFPGFVLWSRGFENDEEIEAVTGGTDAAVRGGTDEVAEGRQELEEDVGGIGLSMWGKCTDEETGNPVEGRAGQCRRWGRGGPVWKDHRWFRLFFSVGFLELVVFLRLFLLLRNVGLLRNVSVFFGGCGECLRGLLADLVSKQLSTWLLYGGERWQRAGRVEWVLSEYHDMKLPRFRFRGSKLRVSHRPSEVLCEA